MICAIIPSAQLDSIVELESLQESVNGFGSDHQFTALVPRIQGLDPDDAFSSVPYEKGYNFLYYLETVVGGPDAFEPFFKLWIQNNSGNCVTSDQFKDFFNNYFRDVPSASQVDWDTWLYAPGMPAIKNNFDQSVVKVAEDLSQKWIDGSIQESDNDIKHFHFNQIYYFLDQLLKAQVNFTSDVLERMDRAYKFSSSKNAEIQFRWCKLGLKCNHEQSVEPTIKMLTSQGRMKYTRPLYRALFSSNVGKDHAIPTFQKHRDFYHKICTKMVSKDLGLE